MQSCLFLGAPGLHEVYWCKSVSLFRSVKVTRADLRYSVPQRDRSWIEEPSGNHLLRKSYVT
ncbi:unnamed protein product [Acanthoscelides obtectus]|nr:unnamed protein product [Acanthoscelides obtectus]CAK1689479.1 hypothetical protein AOBTE_LOCUS37289 [Acanthoscelides obtectus]